MMPENQLKSFLYTCADKTGFNYIARWFTRKGLKVLMYHGVSEDDEPVQCWWQMKQERFSQQIQYLKKEFTIISLDQAYDAFLKNKSLPEKSLVLTFDDGYKNFLTHALPVLKATGVPALLYIPTGPVVAGDLIWSDLLYYVLFTLDKKQLDLRTIDMGCWLFWPEMGRVHAIESIINMLKEMADEKRESILSEIYSLAGVENLKRQKMNNLFSILTSDDIRHLSREHLITIGSHSVSHKPLTTLSPAAVLSELQTSKIYLEQITEKEIRHFCYPAGYYNETIKNFVRDCGYQTAVIVGKTYRVLDNWYEVPRIGLGGYDQDEFFKCQVSGLISFKDKLKHKWV